MKFKLLKDSFSTNDNSGLKKNELELARKIYFDNFGNFGTMKKNGEYKEYLRYRISPKIEHEWSLEIRDQLIAEITSGNNLLMVVALSQVNLSDSLIISAFKLLAASSQRDNIFCEIKRLKPLFEFSMFEKISEIFN